MSGRFEPTRRGVIGAGLAGLLGLVPAVLVTSAAASAGGTAPPPSPAPVPATTVAAPASDAAAIPTVTIVNPGSPDELIDLRASTPVAAGMVLRSTATFANIGTVGLGGSEIPFTVTAETVTTTSIVAVDGNGYTAVRFIDAATQTADSEIAESLAPDYPEAQLVGLPIDVVVAADGTLTSAQFTADVAPTPEQEAALAEYVADLQEAGDLDIDSALPAEPVGAGAEWIGALDIGGPEPLPMNFVLGVNPDQLLLGIVGDFDAALLLADPAEGITASGPVTVAGLVTSSRARPISTQVISVQVAATVGSADGEFQLTSTIAESTDTVIVNADGTVESIPPPETTVASG